MFEIVRTQPAKALWTFDRHKTNKANTSHKRDSYLSDRCVAVTPLPLTGERANLAVNQ